MDSATNDNTDYRRVVRHTDQMQVVLMSLAPGTGLKMEVHPTTAQFVKVEGGAVRVRAHVRRGPFRAMGIEEWTVRQGDAFVVAAGVQHELVVDGMEPATLYTIYSPPVHPGGLVQLVQPPDERLGSV